MSLREWFFGKPNGNYTAKAVAGSSSSVDALSNQSTSPVKAGDGPVLRMQSDLFSFGRERAVSGGVLELRQDESDSLQEHAEAMARETRRDAWDPKKNEQHRLRESEHKKSLVDREAAENAVKFSAALVRDSERELARFPEMERPLASQLLMWGVLFGIAGTIAPTIHDFFFSAVEDAVIAWVFALLSAGFLAAVIVWAILGSISATGRRTAANWAGLLAGVAISLGLGLFRLASASENEEIIAAIALTLLEIGLVVLAEWVATGLREHHREWAARQAARDEAVDALKAAQAQHQRREDHLRDLNRQITAHIGYVEDIYLRNVNLPELIRQAVKAILDGYNAGIAFNRKHVFGAGGSL